MNATELTLPIIIAWRPLRDYPFECLSPEFVAAWRLVEVDLPIYNRERSSNLLLALECLLQITHTKAPTAFNLSTFKEHEMLYKMLLGALHSLHFYGNTQISRNPYIWCLMQCRKRLAENLGTTLTWHLPHSTLKVTPEALLFCGLFEAMELDPVKVLIWQGWPCLTKSGNYTFAPMMPIYNCLGQDFALRLHDLSCTFLAGRQRSVNHAVLALSSFLETTDQKVTSVNLKNPDYVQDLLVDLYEHWLREKYKDGEGTAVARIVNQWRGQITYFFYNYIFPSGLMAEPAGTFPTPKGISIIGQQTNIKLTEQGEVHDKLLTQIPINITDDEALHLLFEKVRDDLESVRKWAWSEIQSMAKKLKRRHLLASQGGVRKIGTTKQKVKFSTNWNDPDHLANGAATFKYYGYPTRRELIHMGQLFPSPSSRWVEELAIPTSYALVPHCALIVHDHPQVTSSFLDNFELYDKNGKMNGLIPTDSGEIAYGAKLRRGPRLAAQEIHLTANAAFALHQIIQLTQPLRDFLRKKNDDSWRYLLLTSSGGFGYPKRATELPKVVNSLGVRQQMTLSASRVLGLSQESAETFARRFSINAVRASAAVVVYLETLSVQEMSKALGHAKLNTNLLDHYLPKVIRDFFQERWVRIFQEGVIVQAMQGSKFLLRASSFNSILELDKFLRTHSLKIPTTPEVYPEQNSEDPWLLGDLPVPKEVIFGLNEEILTILLSLEMAYKQGKRRLLPMAKYWADITSVLVPYVESAAKKRPDIYKYLTDARANASIQMVDHIAYVQA